MVKKLKISLLIIVLFSCQQRQEGITYTDFDFQKLEPVSKQGAESNWYLKAKYQDDRLTNLLFFDKDSGKLLQNDTIYYRETQKYLVNKSRTQIDSSGLDLFRITFKEADKIRRHFLVQKAGKFYLAAVQKQIKPSEFEVRKVNTNSFCLEFNSLSEYIDNIQRSENSKLYFTDYLTLEIFQKDKKTYYKQIFQHKWGSSSGPDFSALANNRGNLYLDLTACEKASAIVDPSILKCLP